METLPSLASSEFQRGLDAYHEAGARAGCSADQMSRFVQAGIFLPFKHLTASAAARECDHNDGPVEVGCGGARGGGKSYWLLAQMGVDDCHRQPGLKCLLLRKVGKAALESIQDLSVKVFRRVPFKLNARGHLLFPNGSSIITGHFKSEGDIDAYLGLEYDAIGIEEATTLTSAKMRMVRTCCRTSKPGWRPRSYNTTNPGGVGHAFYKRRFIEPWRTGSQTETRFIPFTVDDNPHVNSEYRKVLDTLTGWQLRAWRHGDWDIAAGQFFDTFSARHHVVGDDQWDPKRAVEWSAGFDYGFTHYSVFILGAKDNDGRWWIVDMHARARQTVEQHSKQIKNLLLRHGLALSDLRYIAAGRDVFSTESRGDSVQRQYQEQGVKLTAANDDRINGAAKLIQLLGDPDSQDRRQPAKIFILNRCRILAEQIPEMQHDPHRPEDVLKVDMDEEGIGGDDAYDALRYLIMTGGRQAHQTKVRGA